MIVFCGKGFRISTQEKARWDKRVAVVFQHNACVYEAVTRCWINHLWNVSHSSIFEISDP